jgi:hypothetical protein
MKRKLWTFGDSFSTGESKPLVNSLRDKNLVGFNNKIYESSYVKSECKKVAYTTHLSKMLDLEDCNLSQGGMNQQGIVESIVNHHHLIKNEDIVIVTYSTPFRGFKPQDWKETVVDRLSRWDGKPLWESAKLYPLEDESILLDYDSYVMLQYKMYIEVTEKVLKGKNFILTQAFNPIFGYFDTSLLMKKNDNFIEWGKKNNTLHDICADTWLREDEENHMMIKGDTFFKPFGAYFREWNKKAEKEKQYLEYCQHPSPKGHELIAKTLLPYIERLL